VGAFDEKTEVKNRSFTRSSIFHARTFALLNFALVISCSCIYIWPGQDSQDRTARTGQPGQDSQDRTARTGQAEQDSQNRTARTGQQEWDRQNKTALTGQPGHESQIRTGRNMTGKTGNAEQDGQIE
jgi:hypothetical protein